MSTPFYDLASLVFLPSGYKSGKLYAQKPLTTDGQLAFTRASTATRVNASGLVEAVASGVPRLDYLNSTCPKLLLEPQRTNLVAYSEQFDNVYWTKQAGTVVTANQTISPDGTQNADLIVGTGNGIFISALTVPSASPNTKSVYLKGVSGGEVVILQDPTQTVNNTICNLTTSWQRFTLTETQTGGAGGLWIAGIQAGGIYAWGAQLEAGAYATSYIPTLGASVTRVADGAGTSDVFGTTFTLNADFGLYWEGVINGTLVYPCFYSGGNYASGADFRSYFVYNGNTFQLFGVNEALTAQSTIALSLGTPVKILVKRVGSIIKWYVNGTEYANAVGATSTTVKIRSLFGSTLGAPNHESVAQALIFQTTLTDAQCIELTTI
jgi:hypothetical protein